jgi:hypothetical protein
MIDWQVVVDGQFLPGWDQDRDGCWFPNFDYQEFLLPYFDVGDSPIDPYNATEFGDADMRRLREHLMWCRATFEAKSPVWSITETSDNQSRTMSIDRERVLTVVDKTLGMIDLALARGGKLVFRGD